MKKAKPPTIHPLDVSFDWKTTKIEELDLADCQTLTVWHHFSKERNLENLPEIKSLRYLIINFTNAESLKGIEKYPNLEKLELYYAIKLKSIDNLVSQQGLILLSIMNAKRVNDFSVIGKMSNVETLRICDSGDIPSLDFISDMHALKSFSFVGCNIVNGNLSPLLYHFPTLEFIGFNNKRHYSHSRESIYKQLGLDENYL